MNLSKLSPVVALTAAFWAFALHIDAATARGSFDSNGVPIAYTVDGSGEPVILVHGLGSSGDLNWRRPGTVDLLAQHFQVITFDLRGHGRSGKPDTEAAYGVQMVEDITRLLDHLHIAAAHIVGYSLGGIVALDFVVLHPDRTKSLTLGGMGCLLQGSALQAIWAHMASRRTNSMALCMRSVSSLALTPAAIQSIRTPAAVLVGDRDPVERLYVGPLRKIRPDWPVKLIGGAGHINCIAKPQFREELESWLLRQRGR